MKDLSLDTVRPEALEWLTSRLPEVRTGRIITAKRLGGVSMWWPKGVRRSLVWRCATVKLHEVGF